MCRHRWEEVRRAYSPPPASLEVARATAELFRQFTFGVTTVELRCEKCGDVQERLFIGDVRP